MFRVLGWAFVVPLISTALLTASFPSRTHAGVFQFGFSGPGVSGEIQLTYGTATDAKYSQALEVTGISGTFSDSNNGLNLVNVPIVSLEPISPVPGDPLAPHDFSRFAVGSGSLSYDNLYWPSGSAITCTNYPFYGGFLDIYGLLFDIGGGTVVDIWSNGDLSGTGNGPIYGVAVATSNAELDYVPDGVSITPEPSTLALFTLGSLGLLGYNWRRKRVAV